MIEPCVSILSALVVLAACFMRLNILHHSRAQLDRWLVLEALGLVVLVGGLAGAIGEWFFAGQELDFHAETAIVLGAAIFSVGVSHAQLCQIVARLAGWDGNERRCAARAHRP